MQAQIVTEDYIANIPWAKNPAFCFAGNSNIYLEAFRNVIEFVPSTGDRIDFNEDIWDFRSFYKDINTKSYILHFTLAGKDYKDYLKFFTIYSISGKSKISTIERRIGDFIYLINEIKYKS